MLKMLLAVCTLTSLYGCATTPLSDADLQEYNRKQSVHRDTANMSEFDKQQFYTEHNLGPVPAQPLSRPNRN